MAPDYKVPPTQGNDLKTTGLYIHVTVNNFNQDIFLEK